MVKRTSTTSCSHIHENLGQGAKEVVALVMEVVAVARGAVAVAEMEVETVVVTMVG